MVTMASSEAKRAEYKRYYYAHLEERRTSSRLRAAKNRPLNREKCRAWYAENKASERARRIERRYAISQERFRELFVAQGSSCAICERTTPGARGWCIDHDHATGTVRGVLCGPCNSGIGHLGDDAARVEKALAYLRGPR